MPDQRAKCSDSPAVLVAIVHSARLTGDRDLEHAAKHELYERFGIKLTFPRSRDEWQGVGNE